MMGGMARPREFNEEEVLDRALQAFWARGFDATSVDDLVAATGLGRASLYGAFGDKEQLFRRVVARYVEASDRQMEEVTRNLSARDAIRAFVTQRATQACPKDGQRGCFMQMSATTGTSADIIQTAAVEASRQLRAWLLRQLKAAQAAGDLAPDVDVSASADFLFVLLNGLSATARAGLPARALKAAADEALHRVFP
jgi:AcrR family transcriptional regulator